MIYLKNIENITLEDVQGLIHNGISENNFLEFKSELKIQKGDERKEFLKDVSAFANNRGGLLIFGLDENGDGCAGDIKGIEIENVDDSHRQIQDIIIDGVEPIITTFKIKFILIDGNRYLILIKVLQSWNAPHRVKYKGHDKFYIRRDKKVDRITIEELKNMFTGKNTLVENIEIYKKNRVELLSQEFENQSLFIHLIPMHNFIEKNLMNLNDAEEILKKYYPINDYQYFYSFQGLELSYFQYHLAVKPFMKLNRNSVFEAVFNLFSQHNDFINIIPLRWFYDVLKIELFRILDFYKDFGIQPPIVIFISLVNFKNKYLHLDRSHYGVFKEFKENNYEFPPITIENYDDFTIESLSSFLDMLWQACGYPNCQIPLEKDKE